MTLTEFLLARIAEDETVARAAIREPWLETQPRDDGHWDVEGPLDYDCVVEGIGIMIYDEGGHTHEQAVHIARHDPLRALAEQAAKRMILTMHGTWADVYAEPPEQAGGLHGDDHCVGCGFDGTDQIVTEHIDECPILRTLAWVYEDHTDYDQRWAL